MTLVRRKYAGTDGRPKRRKTFRSSPNHNTVLAIAKPICTTPTHIRASMTRSSVRRGGRAITSSVCESTPIAVAGQDHLYRFLRHLGITDIILRSDVNGTSATRSKRR